MASEDSEGADARLAKLKFLFDSLDGRREAAIELRLMSLRTLVLLNGGAIVALFTLLGHVETLKVHPGLLQLAFTGFAGGLVAAVLAIILGYVSQSSYHLDELQEVLAYYEHRYGAGSAQPDLSLFVRGKAAQVGSICFTVIALGLFIFGAFVALRAVEVSPPARALPANSPRRPSVSGPSTNVSLGAPPSVPAARGPPIAPGKAQPN